MHETIEEESESAEEREEGESENCDSTEEREESESTEERDNEKQDSYDYFSSSDGDSMQDTLVQVSIQIKYLQLWGGYVAVDDSTPP